MLYYKMYIILNINYMPLIIFKYKYNFFIKLYLNNYLKMYIYITYFIKNYVIYNKNITKHIKTRSLVNFSNKKIRIQKGLGKARLRNFSSPICKSGGCSFGPINIKNILKINNLTYKLIYIYLLINKRSNIIIIRFENLLYYIILFFKYNKCNNNNINDLIHKILCLYGIINNNIKYKILNTLKFNMCINYNFIDLILNLIKYNYIIYII